MQKIQPLELSLPGREAAVRAVWLGLATLLACWAAVARADDRVTRVRRPTATLKPTAAGAVRAPAAAAPASRRQPQAWFELESTAPSFGEVISGTETELPGAMVLRVHSDRDWLLKVVPGPVRVTDRNLMVPASRLGWRVPGRPGFESFPEHGMAVLATGGPTGGAGRLLVVDLLLALAETDPTGSYRVDLRVILESL